MSSSKIDERKLAARHLEHADVQGGAADPPLASAPSAIPGGSQAAREVASQPWAALPLREGGCLLQAPTSLM